MFICQSVNVCQMHESIILCLLMFMVAGRACGDFRNHCVHVLSLYREIISKSVFEEESNNPFMNFEEINLLTFMPL